MKVPIKEFEDYSITKDGEIFSRKAFQMKLRKDRDGYLKVGLCKNGYQHTKQVHRLVLENFIGTCPLSKETNHKDGNKSNNNIANLEWVTRSENILHSFDNGTRPSKLKRKEVWLIKKLLLSGKFTQKFISKIFKVNPSSICAINTGRYWDRVGL